jgi:hypothetical protein
MSFDKRIVVTWARHRTAAPRTAAGARRGERTMQLNRDPRTTQLPGTRVYWFRAGAREPASVSFNRTRSPMMNLKKMTCRGLVVSMLALSFQTAGAGMIGAEQAAPGTAQTDRSMVLQVLARADTASQLAAMGVDPNQARERVAAMSDQEVTQLASDIREAPAGADVSWLAVIVIAAAIWYFVYRR